METGIDLFEAIESLSAKRRLKPDVVPREVIEQLIYYATRAGSGSNRQNWDFVVITDREKIHRIGQIYSEIGPKAEPSPRDATDQKVASDADFLREHMSDVPCLILVCQGDPAPEDRARLIPRYGSIFPAVQNLMLAARGLGLGTVLTTRHRARDRDVKAALGIPEQIETICLLPIGYPEKPFAKITNRKNPADVTHWNVW